MTTTVWTAIVAVSAIGLVTSPIPTPRPLAAPVALAAVGGPPDTLVVNPRASTIGWRGTGLGGLAVRTGTVGMASGMFVIRHERLTSGTFTVDMRSVDGSLRGPELFDVARYPTAVFNSTGMKRVGQTRWQISGDLTMRGVTRPITFDSDVRWEELGHMIATSRFSIDRRQWGIGSRDAGIADDVVDQGIQLSITLDARRKQAAVATR
jgi:polyisoprenoid-binding protein YceI